MFQQLGHLIFALSMSIAIGIIFCRMAFAQNNSSMQPQYRMPPKAIADLVAQENSATVN